MTLKVAQPPGAVCARPDQVDMDEKKMNCFMVGLSMKLQEHMALNTRGSFPKFVSNIIITDDVIRAHK
jgi:hypothetical protein